MEGKEGYDLRIRTRQYALAIIRFYSALPKTTEAQVIGKQLLRSERRSGHIIAKPAVLNQMPTSLIKSKEAYRNWMKPAIG